MNTITLKQTYIKLKTKRAPVPHDRMCTLWESHAAREYGLTQHEARAVYLVGTMTQPYIGKPLPRMRLHGCTVAHFESALPKLAPLLVHTKTRSRIVWLDAEPDRSDAVARLHPSKADLNRTSKDLAGYKRRLKKQKEERAVANERRREARRREENDEVIKTIVAICSNTPAANTKPEPEPVNAGGAMICAWGIIGTKPCNINHAKT